MHHCTYIAGSIYWLAPEVIRHMNYKCKSDIWSVGCLVIEMLTARHPWPTLTIDQVAWKIGSLAVPEMPSGLSTDLATFLQQCLRV